MMFRFSKCFVGVTLLLNLNVNCMQTDNIATRMYVRNESTTPFIKMNDALTSDNLTTAYYTSDESAARCARRCMNDEICAAFDVKGKADDVTYTKCALKQLKV